MAGRRGAPAAVRGAESEALTLQNTEQPGRHAGRGGTRSGRWAGPGHVWPGGSPELQVQGRRETGQVEQRVEHLHGGGGVQQGREEPHKLGGQGRAVPGQELGVGGRGRLSGTSGWGRPPPRREAGHDLARLPPTCCHRAGAPAAAPHSPPPCDPGTQKHPLRSFLPTLLSASAPTSVPTTRAFPPHCGPLLYLKEPRLRLL